MDNMKKQVIEHLQTAGWQEVAKVASMLGIGCDPEGGHKYADRECPRCGATFCYACCGGTNVDQGGKYDPDYMLCPVCGHDVEKL